MPPGPEYWDYVADVPHDADDSYLQSDTSTERFIVGVEDIELVRERVAAVRGFFAMRTISGGFGVKYMIGDGEGYHEASAGLPGATYTARAIIHVGEEAAGYNLKDLRVGVQLISGTVRCTQALAEVMMCDDAPAGEHGPHGAHASRPTEAWRARNSLQAHGLATGRIPARPPAYRARR